MMDCLILSITCQCQLNLVKSGMVVSVVRSISNLVDENDNMKKVNKKSLIHHNLPRRFSKEQCWDLEKEDKGKELALMG